MIVSYIIPYITPFKESTLYIAHLKFMDAASLGGDNYTAIHELISRRTSPSQRRPSTLDEMGNHVDNERETKGFTRVRDFVPSS